MVGTQSVLPSTTGPCLSWAVFLAARAAMKHGLTNAPDGLKSATETGLATAAPKRKIGRKAETTKSRTLLT